MVYLALQSHQARLSSFVTAEDTYGLRTTKAVNRVQSAKHASLRAQLTFACFGRVIQFRVTSATCPGQANTSTVFDVWGRQRRACCPCLRDTSHTVQLGPGTSYGQTHAGHLYVDVTQGDMQTESGYKPPYKNVADLNRRFNNPADENRRFSMHLRTGIIPPYR
eukprot:6175940-Pleurochrysis_carterae.AAC.1